MTVVMLQIPVINLLQWLNKMLGLSLEYLLLSWSSTSAAKRTRRRRRAGGLYISLPEGIFPSGLLNT